MSLRKNNGSTNSKDNSILPTDIKEIMPSKSGTSFGWNYFTCVNVGWCCLSLGVLIFIGIFSVLIYYAVNAVADYQSGIAPNIQTITTLLAGYFASYNQAIAGGGWTMRGVVNSIYPRDDLEMNEYARMGKSLISNSEIVLNQVIEHEALKTFQMLKPILAKLDPDDVATIVHFAAVQMKNGNMDALFELLIDRSPGSLRSIMNDVHSLNLQQFAQTLNSNTTQQVMTNVGLWAERVTRPEQIDKVLKVTELVDDMHNNDFFNRTSQTLGYINKIFAVGAMNPLGGAP
jgi:hypothetical protein